MTDALKFCLYDRISAEDAVRYDSHELTHSVVKDEERYARFWDSFGHDPEGTLRKFFPLNMKARAESLLRRIAFSTGIYSLVRKVYRKLFGQRKR